MEDCCHCCYAIIFCKLRFSTFLCVLLLLLIPNTIGIPQRGDHPWTLILCKFKDNDFEPKPTEWFTNWLLKDTVDGSVSYFFNTVSNGVHTINGSNVLGWYQIPYSKDDVISLARTDEKLKKRHKDVELRIYHKIKELCILYALRSGGSVHKHVITVTNDDNTAVYCKENGVLLTPNYLLSSALTHEMTHSLNIGHSYSDKKVRIFPHSSLGEYDDKYDLMSTANAYMYQSTFGLAGPGLIGPHLDYLGWLPRDRTYFFGSFGEMDRIIKLSPLSVPFHKTKHLLLLFLPYDKNDPQNLFTVEFRIPNQNDRGITKGAVVIHKIHNRDGYYFSALKSRSGYELREGDSWFEYIDGDQFVRVRVSSLDTWNGVASVRITSTFAPEDCAKDELPRMTVPNDPVCVSAIDQASISKSNKLHRGRRLANGKCLPGFVLREAMPKDKTCVLPKERQLVELQNRKWLKRTRFFNGTSYGMNMCNEGFVWRLLDPYDYVCVKPIRIIVAKHQNNNSLHRWRPNSTDCVDDWVHRNAFKGDVICVTEREHSETHMDNKLQKKALRYYGFFNGIDSVS